MNIERIVSFFGIASGSAAHFPRQVHLVNERTGWRGFVDTFVKPQLDLGVRRFLFWMPFGQDRLRDHRSPSGRTFKSRVRFDQWQQAQAHQRDLPSGQRWMTEGFVDETLKLTDAGCQVICYTGTFTGAPEYEFASGIQRAAFVADSLHPFVDSGCDVAIDSSVGAPAWHPLVKIAEELRSRNMRVYAEAMPYNDPRYGHSIWAHGDIVSDERQYQHAAKDTAEKLFVHPSNIRGEIIRGFWGPPPAPWNANSQFDWAGWYRDTVPEALQDDGGRYSICLQVRAFLNQGGKLEELY